MSITNQLLTKALKESKDTLKWLENRLKEERKEVSLTESSVASFRIRIGEIEDELKEKK